MSKYIIKNCECKVKGKTTLCVRDIPYKKCENITDCILKQIVELAKGHTELCKNCEQQIKECDCNDICNAYRLDKILKLLDIREVE